MADFRPDPFAAFLAPRRADFLALFLALFLAAFFAPFFAPFFAAFRALVLDGFLDVFLAAGLDDFLVGRRSSSSCDERAEVALEEGLVGEVDGVGAVEDGSDGSGSIHPEPDQPSSI